VTNVGELSTDDLVVIGQELIVEIDNELSSDRWAIWNGGSNHQKYLIYDAASRRNCAKLLDELMVAATYSSEMTVRILGRAHIESFIYGLYLHHGGYQALVRIKANAKELNLRLANDLTEWNEWLKTERTKKRRQLKRVRSHNEDLKERNTHYNADQQLPLIDEPHIPRAAYALVNLDEIRNSPKDVDPQALSVLEVIHLLTGLGRVNGFSRESFIPIYHVYRVLSSIGPHPSPYVYDSYVRPHFFDDSFIRTGHSLETPSSANQTLVNALFSTAILSDWVLKGEEGYAPVARRVREQLEPESGDLRGWTPGRL
jgi:hypothetical protein